MTKFTYLHQELKLKVSTEPTVLKVIKGVLGTDILDSLIGTEASLCGGALNSIIRSGCLLDSDIDIFISKDSDLKRFCKVLINNGFVLQSEPSGVMTFRKDCLSLQVILSGALDNIVRVLNDFDFTCVCCGLSFLNMNCYYSLDFKQSLRDMRLEFLENKSCNFNLRELFRIKKYMNKGFSFNLEFYMDLCDKVNRQTRLSSYVLRKDYCATPSNNIFQDLKINKALSGIVYTRELAESLSKYPNLNAVILKEVLNDSGYSV